MKAGESMSMRILAQVVASGRVAVSVLREIFDEAAYARFLAAQELTDCRESYALFERENRAARERRPRCC